jgi:hypothetical protein
MPNNNQTPDTYVIAIPSYKRSELIYKKTLKTLATHLGSYPPVKVYVFLANQTELDEYQQAYPLDFPLAKTSVEFIVGEKGLKNQRNFIMDYFPACTNIVQMDDDLDDILELVIPPKKLSGKRPNRGNRLQSIGNLHEFIVNAFTKCKTSSAYIWGIYPVPNAYFMTPTQTTDLRFIVGPMFGVINRHDKDLQLTTNEKENVERTLQYFTLDGKVVRYNNITVQTRYFKTMVGMQASLRTSVRKANALRAAEYLHNLYPELTKIHLDKKSGWPELKLIDPKQHHGNIRGSLIKTTIKRIRLTPTQKALLGTRKKTRSN